MAALRGRHLARPCKPGSGFDASSRARMGGHYDMNLLDHNAIVGRLEKLMEVACGFSGHGLQQSPAVGRGLAELIVDGRYTASILVLSATRAFRKTARFLSAT